MGMKWDVSTIRLQQSTVGHGETPNRYSFCKASSWTLLFKSPLSIDLPDPLAPELSYIWVLVAFSPCDRVNGALRLEPGPCYGGLYDNLIPYHAVVPAPSHLHSLCAIYRSIPGDPDPSLPGISSMESIHTYAPAASGCLQRSTHFQLACLWSSSRRISTDLIHQASSGPEWGLTLLSAQPSPHVSLSEISLPHTLPMDGLSPTRLPLSEKGKK